MQSFPKIPNTQMFLAGGFVRDTLMGKTPKDRDFVVLTPMGFSEFVEAVNAVGMVFQSMPQNLTVRAKVEGEVVDFAFPRVESGYVDFRHPTFVERVNTLEADASRRDFTINAMFMDEAGEIQDFFNGREDLINGIIHAVGNPFERFQEDALRILRAVRFECKLDFHIDSVTFEAMKAGAENLHHISAERIRDEINGALRANSDLAIKRFAQLNVFDLMREKGLRFEATARKE